MFGIPKMKLKRDILLLLAAVLIMHIASYIIIPIFPVILSSEKGLNAGQVGLIIGSGSLAFQAGSVVGGIMSDRIGRKATMVIGAAAQSAALFGYGTSSAFTLILLFSILNGTGTGVYAPTLKAAIAAIASDSAETRTTAFSLRGVAANIGVSIAGLLILYFSAKNSIIAFYTASAVFLTLAVLTWILLPKKCEGGVCPIVPPNSYLQILKNKSFVIFALLSVLVWAIYSQLSLLLPLRADAVLQNGKIVGTIWTITSIVVIIFQSIISKYILQKINPFSSLMWGVLFLGAGLISIGLSYNFLHLTLSAVIFLVGEMLMLPTTDSLTSQLANPELIGAYFSIASLVSGIGTAAGNFAGGKLMDIYGVKASMTPWTMLGILSVITAAAIFFVKRLPIIAGAIEKK